MARFSLFRTFRRHDVCLLCILLLRKLLEQASNQKILLILFVIVE